MSTAPPPSINVLDRGRGWLSRHLAGLLWVVGASAVCMAAGTWLGVVSPLLLAIGAGVVVRNLGLVRASATPGLAWASKRLLRAGVVLLGLQLSLPQVFSLGIGGIAVIVITVTVTFVGTRLLGRLFRLPAVLTTLVATGFSICGAAAIAAMSPVADPDGEHEEDTATAVALVTLYGSIMIAVMPLAVNLVGFDDHQAGLWIGASVHEVAQVVAAGTAVSAGALATATVTKLGRVVLLAPLVAVESILRRRRGTASAPSTAHQPSTPGWRRGLNAVTSVVPAFVLGFLAMIAVRSLGIVPAVVLDVVKVGTTTMLTAAMFALGCGVHLRSLVATGGRALLLGAASTVLAVLVSLLAIVALT